MTRSASSSPFATHCNKTFQISLSYNTCHVITGRVRVYVRIIVGVRNSVMARARIRVRVMA